MPTRDKIDRRKGQKRSLCDADLELWKRATRDVRPIEPVRIEPSPRQTTGPSPEIRTDRLRSVYPSAPAHHHEPHGSHASIQHIDRHTLRRLRRGQIAVTARLDLHGMTQEESYSRLKHFLHQSRRHGHKYVLVITGLGLARGGVLRTMVPRWLDSSEMRDDVLGHTAARQRDGGEGARYVVLRRQS